MDGNRPNHLDKNIALNATGKNCRYLFDPISNVNMPKVPGARLAVMLVFPVSNDQHHLIAKPK